MSDQSTKQTRNPPPCLGMAGAWLGHNYESVTVERKQGDLVAEMYLGESCTRCGHWIPATYSLPSEPGSGGQRDGFSRTPHGL